MKKSKKWLIMLADSFIARAVAIFLFFLAIITGVKEFFLSSNDFISKYSVPYFILSIIISIIISAIFTFYLKGYKISDSTNIDNMDNDDGVKSRLIDRIGSSRSLQIYYHDEVDVKHKYTQIKRYDILDYSQSDYKSIRELHGINASKEPTLYIPYSESTEYKVSFKDIKIIAYDIATGQELQDAANISFQCKKYGMPLLAMMYVRNNDNITSLDIHHIIHTVRIATELGADIVKIPFPNDELALQHIVKNSLVPIVVAGGGEILGDEELRNKTKLVMENGAKGVCYGRNIIKSQNPRHTISLLKSTLIT